MGSRPAGVLFQLESTFKSLFSSVPQEEGAAIFGIQGDAFPSILDVQRQYYLSAAVSENEIGCRFAIFNFQQRSLFGAQFNQLPLRGRSCVMQRACCARICSKVAEAVWAWATAAAASFLISASWSRMPFASRFVCWRGQKDG